MAEFSEVIKQFNRMCDSMSECRCCPMRVHASCSLEDILDNPTKTEEVVMEWAERNSQPKVPTWGDWFASRGDLISNWRDLKVVMKNGDPCVIGFLYEHIPDDIAEKLNIKSS